ncbi:MAG: SpoVR family protein [Candidatus Spechtbacteria bacterium]|nr:SpoVR family protein [Candidatus Spechtbacteria bacterium]
MSNNILVDYYEQFKQAAIGMNLSVPANDPTIYIVNKRQQEAVAAMNGGPRKYSHWSFGKNADFFHHGKRIYFCDLMAMGIEPRAFMPYDFSLGGQLFFLAYFLALNDFVSHNRAWFNVPDDVWDRSRTNSERISQYRNDDAIGYEKVEHVLTAAHAMRYQCSHSALWGDKTCDLLEETIFASTVLENWQKDILRIVHDEWKWLLPRIETKLMMAGYASFFATRIVEAAGVSDDLFAQCRQAHEETVAFPKPGSLNLQQIGSVLFEAIDSNYGREALFHARDTMHDVTFVARFLDQKIAQENSLFSWSPAPGDEHEEIYLVAERIRITDISDERGWKKVSDRFIECLGYAPNLPVRIVKTPDTEGRLVLLHTYQGKVFEPKMLRGALELMYSLWKIPIEVIIATKKGVIRHTYDRKNGFRIRDF